LCRPGDLVVNTMWAWMAALGVAKQSGIVSPSYAVYRLREGEAFVPEYLDHLLRTKPFVSEYYSRSTGIRTSRLRLYPEEFLGIPIVRAPLEEQATMVAYLRAKDHQIADFIRAKRRLIKLLNEQKQAIIHHAVTGGLDPDVPMKPTGFDWLPEVPEHWEIKPLKRWTKINGRTLPETTEPDYVFQYLDIGAVGPAS
jgi:type I restriction enzyme, S subunit